MCTRLHCLLATALVVLVPATLNATEPNLLPNGGADIEFVNAMKYEKGFASWIQPRDTGVPPFWRLTGGAALSREEVYAGDGAIQLAAGGGTGAASATAYADFWRVLDPAMPFGLPVLPGRPVRLSFWYKTSPEMTPETFRAEVVFGTVDGLPSTTHAIPLPPAAGWTYVERSLVPKSLHWGVEVTFALDGDAPEAQTAWIDEISLTQPWPDFTNLVHNGSFEKSAPASAWPQGWDMPVEDQWISWVGARYRAPERDQGASVSGRHALRATVIHGEVSGISQEIRLDQDKPRPVFVDLWAKFGNSVGNFPPGYHGPDNLPILVIYVYYADGSMQEVSPTFCLAKTDAGWRYRRAGLMPLKPVERIRLQVTVVGTEPTTSLWIDDVRAWELGNGVALPSARYAPPRTVSSVWDALPDTGGESVTAANGRTHLELHVPLRPDARETRLFFNSRAHAEFMDYQRYYYHVLRLAADGAGEWGDVVEKQGHVVTGGLVPAEAMEIEAERTDTGYRLRIPFRALRMDGPGDAQLGFNVEWQTPGGPAYWTGKSAAVEQLGAVLLARQRRFTLEAVEFGERWRLEPDQSQDHVTHPQVYAGTNTARVTVTNHGEPARVTVAGGIHGETPAGVTAHFAQGETRTVPVTYDAGAGPAVATFQVILQTEGAEPLVATFPLEVPQPIELVLDQEFYFPDEPAARLEVHNRFRPIPDEGTLTVTIHDLAEDRTVYRAEHQCAEAVDTLMLPLDGLRVHALPLQDYEVRAAYHRDGGQIGEARARVGRLEPVKRRPLPPIKQIDIDETGRVVINGDFRFFPIVPSIASDDHMDGIALGANVYRAYYPPRRDEGDIFAIADRAWDAGAYTLTIGPGPGALETFEEQSDRLLAHPGFLSCYAKQFYYWNLPPDLEAYRSNVEARMAAAKTPKLLIWGHHDSSLLYDLERTAPPDPGLLLGYCYTKIMSRPGPAWRNAPFLTLTERTLAPGRFRLAEVNYYVSWADDEIVPEHFKTYRSLRANHWRGVRHESYLAIIYGANGLYHYICTQPGGLQRLRGWFHELNHLWPVFVADDAPHRVTVHPAGSGIEARVKRWNGKLYLLTANAAEAPREAAIQVHGLGGGATVKKLFDLPGAMKFDGGALSDAWDAADAFVYEITDATR